MARHGTAQRGAGHCQLTVVVALIADVALAAGVGLGEVGAVRTGVAVAVIEMNRAGGLQVRPCAGSRVTRSTATTWQSRATTPGTPCRARCASLTCWTLGTAPMNCIDPVHPRGAGELCCEPPWTGEQPRWALLPPCRGAILAAQGQQAACQQPQRCQDNLQAGKGQGCRQPAPRHGVGAPGSRAAVPGCRAYRASSHAAGTGTEL